MKLKKLQTITEKQYERLRLAGIEVGKKTKVQEVLKFMQTIDAIELLNLNAPMYCRIYVSAYYVAEVCWFGEISKEKNGLLAWYSHGVHSWEIAESLALDFMLGTLDEKEYPNYKIDKLEIEDNICKCCGKKMKNQNRRESQYLCMNPYCDNYIKINKL